MSTDYPEEGQVMMMTNSEQALNNEVFEFSEENLNQLAKEVRTEEVEVTGDYADFLDDVLPEIDFNLVTSLQSKVPEQKTLISPKLELIDTEIDHVLSKEGMDSNDSVQKTTEDDVSEGSSVSEGNATEVSNEATESDTPPAPEKARMKIKEIKYGMTVITNIGNYENIRTHIEATAEIESNEDFLSSVEELSSQIRTIGRSEYRDIKRRSGHSPLNNQARPQYVSPPVQSQQQMPVNSIENQKSNPVQEETLPESPLPDSVETE